MLAVQCVLHQGSHFPSALSVWEKSNPHNQFLSPSNPYPESLEFIYLPPSLFFCDGHLDLILNPPSGTVFNI